MTERFGTCRDCKGIGSIILRDTLNVPRKKKCMKCDGTGSSGDAIDYLQKQADADWDRERSYENYEPWFKE